MYLADSGVQFNDELHTYTLNGERLQGITSTLLKSLFPDTYKGVDEEVLKKATERGSLIHEQCELADAGMITDTYEVQGYLKLKKKHGLTTLANEYIVTDRELFASPIDVVFDDYSLADIKTTYTLNKDYVSWQLSIYAYLFEMQNPSLKANKLYAIHLRPTACKLVEVQRKTNQQIEELIENYCKGLPSRKEVPSLIIDLQQAVIDIEKQVKELKAKQDELRAGILKEMDKADVKKWETDSLILTRVLPTTKEGFDTKKFKEDYQELYESYTKVTNVKSSLKITIK
ncbi:MAG: hypothetical protein ACRCZZ_09955 [Phocaeicola sp.]